MYVFPILYRPSRGPPQEGAVPADAGEMSLRLLAHYAASVRHRQYRANGRVTVRVEERRAPRCFLHVQLLQFPFVVPRRSRCSRGVIHGLLAVARGRGVPP